MKKVLLATTALALSAGWTTVAAAQDTGVSVGLSGYAAMGIVGGDKISGQIDEIDGVGDPLDPLGDLGDIEDTETSFATDIDVTFSLVGQTDGGLEFGADIDLDEATDAGIGADFENPREQRGEVVYISGAFGTLTMGDTDGALDWAMSEAIIGGTIGDVTEHAGFLGSVAVDNDADGLPDGTYALVDGNKGLDGTYDGQIARYEYAFADFAVAISGEIDDNADGDPILGIGAKYSTSFSGIEMSFGAGVQTISGLEDLADDAIDAIDPDDEIEDNQTVWGLSGDMAFAQGVRVILNYSHWDDLGEHYGAAVGYETGPILVSANYGHFNGDVVGDAEGWGLTANYDLGGGAQLQAGYSNNDVEGFDSEQQYSFGVAMSF